MDIAVFLSLWGGVLVPMYVLVSLGPLLTECWITHWGISSVSCSCQLGDNQSITSSCGIGWSIGALSVMLGS